MKTHGDVPGNICPDRDILFLAWRRVGSRQFLQYFPGSDGPEEVSFRYFSHPFEIIELAPSKSLNYQSIIALEEPGG